MIAAASDSTPGDMLMAATVYTIAAAAKHPLAEEVGTGRIKVDQVANRAAGDFAGYSAMGAGKEKGDTITVPAQLDVTDLAHRRAVIHELEHAMQDKPAAHGRVRHGQRDLAELAAYRAGARYELAQLLALDGTPPPPARATAIKQVAQQSHPVFLLAFILEAHQDPNQQAHLDVIADEINAAAPSNRRVPDPIFNALLALPNADLDAELLARIRRQYQLSDAAGNVLPTANLAKEDGRAGESMLDWADRQ
jgi:hypothetical protein